MAHRNMIGGVTGNGELNLRVGPDDYIDARQHPHAREMDFTGRARRGFVLVNAMGITTDEDRRWWLHGGLKHALSLPPKVN